MTDPTRRGQLIHWIDLQPSAGEQPLPTLRKLLIEAERPLLGATRPLRGHGDVGKRAELAATGAMLLLLDQKVCQCVAELMSRVQFVSASSYPEGRCYRLGLDEQPLLQLPKLREEAQLFVDLKDFTKRTAAIKEQAMGDFLKRYFYQPIFELAATLKSSSPNALSVVNILGDAVAFRGEIAPLVSLALGIRRILAKAEQELTQSVSEVLGGDPRLSEIDEEIALTSAELERIEKDLDGVLPMVNAGPLSGGERRQQLRAQLAMLHEAREQRCARSVGLGLEAGVYISFGAAAENVDLSHPSLGPWSVTIGERLNEAARGTARSAQVKAERDFAVARARMERKSPPLDSPFQVRVGKSYHLQLSPAHTEALESAIHRTDKHAVTGSVRELAQWLHQAASDAVEQQEGNLPRCIVRSEDLYNAGCALSGPALDAFEKATKGSLRFRKIEVYHSQLPPEFHRKHLLEYDPERIVVVSDPERDAAIYLLRFTGKALFKGFEAHGGIDVWELLLPDAAFGRDLLSALESDSRRQPMARPRAAGEIAR